VGRTKKSRLMQITKPLVRFGLFLFVADCLFYLVMGTSLLGAKLLGVFMLGLPVPFAAISGPVILSLIAAGAAMALGMWKCAESTPELKALIYGQLLLCVVFPQLALMAVFAGGTLIIGWIH
jgi:hypothetical protein